MTGEHHGQGDVARCQLSAHRTGEHDPDGAEIADREDEVAQETQQLGAVPCRGSDAIDRPRKLSPPSYEVRPVSEQPGLASHRHVRCQPD